MEWAADATPNMCEGSNQRGEAEGVPAVVKAECRKQSKRVWAKTEWPTMTRADGVMQE